MRRLLAPLRTSFARHASILSSGQFMAAAVSLLAAPVLSRIYPPAAYGVLASYMAVAAVLSTISNWQYSQAIIVESSHRRAFALVWLSIYATLASTVGATAIGIGLWLLPSAGHELHEAAAWFLLLPLTVLCAGPVAALGALATRLAHFRRIATVQVLASVVTVAFSFGLGLAHWGVTGLMVGYFAGQICSLIVYGRLWLSLDRPPRPKWRYVKALASKHRHFAFWTTPSMFVGQFGMQVPIYLLGLANNLTYVGAFSRGRQLLLLPLGLVGTAISQVFYQRASADMARDGNCVRLYRKAAIGLFVLATPPVAVLMIIAPWLFTFLLGPNWTIAGEIARVLAPMLLLQLICGPIAIVMLIAGRQAEDFWFQTGFAALTAVFAGIPLVLGLGAYAIVVGYAVGQSLMYLAYFVRCDWLAHGRTRPK